MFKQTVLALLLTALIAAVLAAQIDISQMCTTVTAGPVVYDPVADTTTFNYIVTVPLPQNCQPGQNTKDLSHWDLEICPELTPFIVSTNPPATIGLDPSISVSLYVIKWDQGQSVGTVQQYSVTISGRVDVGTTRYVIKNQDFAIGSGLAGPVCGSLNVFKYNDLNGNGHFDVGEPGLNGWAFTVTGPGGTCSFTTSNSNPFNQNGYGNCNNLPTGTYTITETLLNGWTNTDPGTSLTKTISYIKGSSPTIRFGNSCPMTITFRVCGIPPYFGSNTQLQLIYNFNPPANPAPAPVNMVYDPITQCATAIVSNQFSLNSVIDWGIQAPTFGSVILVTGQTFSSCEQTVTATLSLTSVVAHKYKDLPPIGTYQSNTDTPLSGFTFTLTRQGSPGYSLVVVSNNGLINLGTLAPGDYTLTETVPTGWKVTPASGTINFHINFGETSRDVGNFLDSPYTNVDINVTSPSGFTKGKISCTTATGETVVDVLNSVTLQNLLLSASQIQCTIVLSDP